MMTLTIDGTRVEAREGSTVLEAALAADLYIPNLCYHPDLRPTGSCRLCIIEVEGQRGWPTACTLPAAEGMTVRTRTDELQTQRRRLLSLLLSESPRALKQGTAFRRLVDYVGLWEALPPPDPAGRDLPVRDTDPLIVRDPNLCILCGRCVRICGEVRGVGAIGLTHRGAESRVDSSFGRPLKDDACRFCGACVEVCPTGALSDREPVCGADGKPGLPCQEACPAGIDIPSYVRFIAEGRYDDALAVVREKAPFPFTLGCICIHPCEQACRRCDVNDPVAVRELKRFVAEADSGAWRKRLHRAPDTGRRVAVVGAGPAGLTAAWFLRLKGHAVEVLDALPKAGGTMWSCIPRYRLAEETLEDEVRLIEKIGVRIRTGTRVESLEELFASGAEAVLLAMGAVHGTRMGIPGEDHPRVADGFAFLQAVNLGRSTDASGRAVVVGGGNVALDCVRTLRRLGAAQVTLLYRRTREEMPAASEEIEYAIEEGVDIRFLVNPVRIEGSDTGLRITCVRMELGEPDQSGRRRPVPAPGSEFEIEAERLIMAIGQRPAVPEPFGLALDRHGCLVADPETGACSRPKVFAAGDAVSGAASVIEAIAAGRKAAAAIDRCLGGDGDIGGPLVERDPLSARLGREPGFAARARAATPVLEPDRRLSFDEVEQTFTAETARAEASRCLRCQLRRAITPAPHPPERSTP